MTWWQAAPVLLLIAAAAVVAFRWLLALERRTGDHAERLARVEGRRDPK